VRPNKKVYEQYVKKKLLNKAELIISTLTSFVWSPKADKSATRIGG